MNRQRMREEKMLFITSDRGLGISPTENKLVTHSRQFLPPVLLGNSFLM